MRLIDASRLTMRQSGNAKQWPDGYPSRAVVEDDVRRADCYLICAVDGLPVGSFVVREGPDPSYSRLYGGRWVDDERPYRVVHRLTSLPTAHGVFGAMMSFCRSLTDNLRMDTHRDNRVMQHLLLKHGFQYCGIIHLQSNGEERLAYQSCPLPVR